MIFIGLLFDVSWILSVRIWSRDTGCRNQKTGLKETYYEYVRYVKGSIDTKFFCIKSLVIHSGVGLGQPLRLLFFLINFWFRGKKVNLRITGIKFTFKNIPKCFNVRQENNLVFMWSYFLSSERNHTLFSTFEYYKLF